MKEENNTYITVYNKTNKIISITLLLLITFIQVIALPINVQAYTEGVDGIKLISSSNSLSVGDKVEVIFAATGQGVSGVTGFLEYDTDIFEKLKIEDIETACDTEWTKNLNDNDNYIEMITVGGGYKTGNLFKITFTVKKKATKTEVSIKESEVSFADKTTAGSGGIPFVNETVEIKAPSEYTVTYNKNTEDEVTGMPSPETENKQEGEEHTIAAAPTRTGYRFTGWKLNETETIYQAGSKITVNSDINLYAHWTPNQYTVTFDAGEGGTVEPGQKEVTYDGKYGELPIPTKPESTFKGWVDKDGNPVTKDTIVKITEDTTLTAIWEGTKYTVTFKNDDGTVIKITNADHGDKIEFDGQTPVKNDVAPGYEAKFDGWENSEKLENITGNTTVSAKYIVTPIVYNITYNNLKGSDNSKNPVTYTVEDENIILSNLPNQEKLIFKGWYTTVNNTETKVTSIDTAKLGNITLNAKWEEEGLYLKSEKYKVGENDIDNYEDGDVYLDKIEPNTTLEQFINNCETNGKIIVINENGDILENDDLVGTNMTIKVTRYDEEITMTAVVMGDIDGDGKATAQDLSELNKAYLGTLEKELIEARFKAADIDDSKKVTATDLSELNRASLGISKLTYNKRANMSIGTTMLQ